VERWEAYGISPTNRKPVSDGPAGMLCFSACYEEHNTANERRGAKMGGSGTLCVCSRVA